MKARLKCVRCGEEFNVFSGLTQCPKCGGELIPELRCLKPEPVGGKGVWAWSNVLVTGVFERKVTLMEGNTPLIRALELERRLGLRRIFLKDESRNPTGTFIDRGAATLATAALGLGIMRLVTASLGDLGVSIAAYARRAGIRCKVLMPSTSPPTKIYQSLALSSSLELVSSYEEAVDKALRYGAREGSMPVTSKNPYLLDGYRTLPLEVVRELGSSPDVILVPVGDGSLAYAVWQVINALGGNSRLVGVKASSKSPILKDVSVEKPLMLKLLKEALESTGGFIVEVSEREVVSALKLLADCEGLLVEPAGATAIAALANLSRELPSNSSVVAVMTGGPARDPAALSLLVEGRELKSVKRIGSTKIKILEILAMEGPLHPYATWKLLTERYGLRISLRSIYQHFNELVKSELIEPVKGEGRRHLFRITSKGLEMIRR